MKFPAYPSKGKLVSDTVRDILNYVRSTRITKVVGGKVKVTPNGTTIDVSRSVSNVSQNLHFKVTGATKDGSNYKCRVRGGYVLVRTTIQGEDSITRVIPRISISGTLTELPPEDTAEITLTSGQAVFCKIETDDMDTLDDDGGSPPVPSVTIVAASESEASEQAQPIDDSNVSGVDGLYFYPLALMDVDESDNATIKQVQQGGPITHDPLLWKGENIGAGAKVFKDRDTTNNKYRFRSIIGDDGVDVTENSGDITITLDGEDLNLQIHGLSYDNDGAVYGSGSVIDTLYFRNGLYIGATDPSDGLGATKHVTYLTPAP